MSTFKKFAAGCAATFLAIGLTYFGYLCFTYFVMTEVSLVSVLVGLLGWHLLAGPSVQKWKQLFLDVWEGKE